MNQNWLKVADRSTVQVSLSALLGCGILLIAGTASRPAEAQTLQIRSGPQSGTSGGQYKAFIVAQDTPGATLTPEGGAIGTGTWYDDTGTARGTRALYWDASGSIELTHLGLSSSGTATSVVGSMNRDGLMVGYSELYLGGVLKGPRAMVWQKNVAALRLADLGTDPSGVGSAVAVDVTDTGSIVGNSNKYIAGVNAGVRAVRWDSSGAVIELPVLSSASVGGTSASTVSKIRNDGTIIGQASRYVGNSNLGARAVRWDPDGSIHELGNLGTSAAGFTSAQTSDINSSGTIVGIADKYVGGVYEQEHAARWSPDGTITQLPVPGSETRFSTANDINDSGTAIGYFEKYSGQTFLGGRGIKWDADGNAILLPGLGSTAAGHTNIFAQAINRQGTTVGYVEQYNNSVYKGYRAVYWTPDNQLVNLNDLIDPASGWTLNQANAINDEGWIAGAGTYDPDGAGGESAHVALWSMQVPGTVPEPATLAMALLVGLGTILRRRTRG